MNYQEKELFQMAIKMKIKKKIIYLKNYFIYGLLILL